MTSTFHNDTKFCPCCSKYVHFLSSIELSYCVECGAQCEMFSKEDRLAFQAKMAARKPKGGRPRKNARREAATTARAAA
jgi:anaerobic ribonucleoside-triphosphate reductase